MAMAMAGHKVWVGDSFGSPIGAASPYIQSLLRLSSPRVNFRRFVSDLIAACTDKAIDVIIPTSEEVFWLAGAVPFLPKSVDIRTSPLPILELLHHKVKFARLATSLGFGVPENYEITQPSDLARLDSEPRRFVLKPVYSRFATRTLIFPTAGEIARLQPSPANAWLAQTRVSGRELCAYNVAHAGRLLLHVAYEPKYRIGVGASVYFSPVSNERLRLMSERIIGETGFSGQISFDAMETEHGLVALECNPRGTSGVHLAVQQPLVLAEALLGSRMEPAPFLAAPRMLLLPLLLNHPGFVFRRKSRHMIRTAKDALVSAGIPLWAQAKALAELGWLAIRTGRSMPLASTADIEWNGEEISG
jgi:hypothetical protein